MPPERVKVFSSLGRKSNTSCWWWSLTLYYYPHRILLHFFFSSSFLLHPQTFKLNFMINIYIHKRHFSNCQLTILQPCRTWPKGCCTVVSFASKKTYGFQIQPKQNGNTASISRLNSPRLVKSWESGREYCYVTDYYELGWRTWLTHTDQCQWIFVRWLRNNKTRLKIVGGTLWEIRSARVIM